MPSATRSCARRGGARSEIARIGGIGSLRGPAQRAERSVRRGRCAGAGRQAKSAIQKGLRSFPGLAHRMEQVGRRGGVLFVNDSKGTNADATARALSSFNDIFWIAGGKPKTGGITSLAEFFPRIRKAYLIGEAAQEFAARSAQKCRTRFRRRSTMRSSQPRAMRRPPGSTDPVVLLSPACASFDQYRNFEIRGNRFRELVQALPGVKPVN